jgi:hypothetical protein
MQHQTGYAETFRKLQPKFDPRHIEAYIRLEYATLGHLSIEVMRREASIAAMCVEEGGLEAAEDCAQSFGL